MLGYLQDNDFQKWYDGRKCFLQDATTEKAYPPFSYLTGDLFMLWMLCQAAGSGREAFATLPWMQGQMSRCSA